MACAGSSFLAASIAAGLISRDPAVGSIRVRTSPNVGDVGHVGQTLQRACREAVPVSAGRGPGCGAGRVSPDAGWRLAGSPDRCLRPSPVRREPPSRPSTTRRELHGDQSLGRGAAGRSFGLREQLHDPLELLRAPQPGEREDRLIAGRRVDRVGRVDELLERRDDRWDRSAGRAIATPGAGRLARDRQCTDQTLEGGLVLRGSSPGPSTRRRS